MILTVALAMLKPHSYTGISRGIVSADEETFTRRTAMDGAIFTMRGDGRTRAVENIARIDGWKKDHNDAMFALDVQDMLAEYIEHQEFLRRMWEDSLQRAIDGTLDNLDHAGEFLLDMFDRSLSAFEFAKSKADIAKSLGHTIERERAFRRGVTETRKLRHYIKKRWPFTDQEAMQDALRCYREGRSRPIRDIIQEIRG